MKVILIHGENVIDARKRYGSIVSSVKKKGWQIAHATITSKNPLSELLVSNSLFPEDILYTLDGMGSMSEKDLLWLKNESDSISGNLLIFHKGEASATHLKHLPKSAKVEKFDVPKVLFQFLETIYPGNQARALSSLQEVLKTQPEELVIAMLSRQLRDLYWLKVDKTSMAGPQWKIGKLTKQATCFSSDGLKSLISELAEADINAKTGEVPLRVSLDLILTRQLQ